MPNFRIPHLLDADIPMFYKYIDSAKVYLEFGSGGSTYQASLRKNISKIYSVESDPWFIEKMKRLLPHDSNVEFNFCDVNTIQDTWGEPGEGCTVKQKNELFGLCSDL